MVALVPAVFTSACFSHRRFAVSYLRLKRNPRNWAALLILGVIGMLARLLAAGVYLDQDLFHEMALARTAIEQGRMPLHDQFAYTPTVYPVVHHEWGSGMVFYFLMTRGGPAALMGLRLTLVAVLLLLLMMTARLRGARWICIFLTTPLALILLTIGFTTVRAQLFSMVFTALLLLILRLTETRTARWLLPWPAMQLIWQNLHAGFVVGLGFLFFFAVERSIRQRRVAWNHLAVLLVCIALIPINPYGLAYFPFLWRSLTMPRPLILEWHPLWTSGLYFGCFLLTIILLIYSLVMLRPKNMANAVVLIIGAGLALLHIRHVAIYGILWVALVPAYIQLTPLGAMMQQIWQKHQRSLGLVYALAGVACMVIAMRDRPWAARLPSTMEDHRQGVRLLFSVGPVEFLRKRHVKANVLAPFELGAYLSWELWPDIKVAVDGRYEVAYPPAQVEEFLHFYAADPSWKQTLLRYPPDMVLIPRGSAIADAFASLPDWAVVYSDELFLLYGRTKQWPNRASTQ